MSRTYRKNDDRSNRRGRKDHKGRPVTHQAMGIKRLGESDLDSKRQAVVSWMRDHRNQVMTVGRVQGFGFTFRFQDIWSWMYPKERCPARK